MTDTPATFRLRARRVVTPEGVLLRVAETVASRLGTSTLGSERVELPQQGTPSAVAVST
jgi:hypothetical protein